MSPVTARRGSVYGRIGEYGIVSIITINVKLSRDTAKRRNHLPRSPDLTSIQSCQYGEGRDLHHVYK